VAQHGTQIITVYTSCDQNQKLHTSCDHSKYISSMYGIYHAILFTKKLQQLSFHFLNKLRTVYTIFIV
jgi:hypothetical protein